MNVKTINKIVTYTDGASRGNPGEASLGVVIEDAHGNMLKEYGEALGVKTNNEAEYEAIVVALKKVRALVGKAQSKNVSVEMRMDSKLAAEQLSGRYRLNSEKLYEPFIAIWNGKMDFKEVTFKHIPREKNKEADRLANEALDALQQKLL